MFWPTIILVVIQTFKLAYVTANCYTNQIIQNGWIESESTNEKLSYGRPVPENTVISYRCNKNYIIDGHQKNFCYQNSWLNENPKCVPRCSTRSIQGLSIQPSSCTLNGRAVNCAEPSKPGTIANIECRNRYERFAGPPQQTIVCQENGEWSPSPQVCTPTCGEEFPSGTPYIVNGHEANITLVPWHVGIYKYNGSGYDYICGGSIVNARVVISAMHCFWDSSMDRPYNASLYRIGAGKSLLDFNAIESYKEQKFGVEKFVYPPGYADYANNYQADLALLILSGNIEFDTHVAPVCIPYGLQFSEIHVPSGWSGRVAGWGLTSSGGTVSPSLKYLEIPTVDTAQCRREASVDFRPQITSDKFCAGVLNINTSLCQGDSGGGLVVANEQGKRRVFQLRGVVSAGPRSENSCDSNQYTTFTNILYYQQMISEYNARESYYTEMIADTPATPSYETSNGCAVTKTPENGWISLTAPAGQKLFVGDSVNELTTVTYECKKDYSLDGGGPISNVCHLGKWKAEVPNCKMDAKSPFQFFFYLGPNPERFGKN